MKLSSIYVRFYKSFNFDHVRKAARNAESRGEWEMYEGQWYPYVEIPVDARITTVVGANESGKSHTLSAIEKSITGKGFDRRDLCRYSPFFGVERDQKCWPHLGVAWTELAAGEATAVAAAAGLTSLTIDHFMMFREGPDELTLWLPDGDGGWRRGDLNGTAAAEFTRDVLPRPFRIHSDVALPDSIPFAWLRDRSTPAGTQTTRRARADLLEGAAALGRLWGPDYQTVATNASAIFSTLSPFVASLAAGDADAPSTRSLELARDLLLKLANVEPERIADLANAIADGHDGYANAITESINGQLERNLNFKKWWVQDRDFSLRVTPREHDLVFTIRDRTGTEYTFGERSSGLKYFLSYLIQSQSHRPTAARERILLMDEPDTYLSAEAQQDLMRIFRDLVEAQPDRPPVQVVYVTHSPFLIDKNHAERIRVLEKGKGYDGTRVVKNVSQNHYEPLRSAFGSYVGETAFIGSVNLLVEGVADQVMLAGAARTIRRQGPGPEGDTLDLNRLVIVPCGSASQVPYMVYLVRGRDAEKPPVVALLDSDPAGDEAARLLGKDKRLKRLIDARHVLQLGGLDLAGGANVTELEDVVPVALAVAAARTCLEEIALFRTGPAPAITVADLAARPGPDRPMFDAINEVLGTRGSHIEKLAFARAVVDISSAPPSPDEALENAKSEFLARMRRLFRAINKARREAERVAGTERLSSMVDRHQTLFGRDHPVTATREQGGNLLEELDGLLDGSLEADAIRAAMQGMRRDFSLNDDPASAIVDLEAFKTRLGGLKVALDVERLSPAATAARSEEVPA